MNINDLSRQFHQEARRIARIVKNRFSKSGNISTNVEEKGVRIHVWFRSEEDYNLLVPWEYTESEDTIDYYLDKWSKYTNNATTVGQKALLSEEFEDNILKGLGK